MGFANANENKRFYTSDRKDIRIMPLLFGWAAIIAATGTTFKLVTSGAEDLADSSIKLAGAALAVGAGYVVAKKMKVI